MLTTTKTVAKSKMQPLITGMSRLEIASNASRPTPGHAKMLSVKTAPPSKRPVCKPTTVMIGTSAFRSAWRITIVRASSPFARAVRT